MNDDTLINKLEEINKSISEIKSSHRDISNSLNGNGHPGLKTLVYANTEWISGAKKMYLAVIAAVAASGVSLITAVITALFH